VRLYRFPFSTNVERVALALAHKGLEVDSVWIDPADRTPVRAVSGQDLVPVLVDDDGEVHVESMDIVRWLDERWPDQPLYPPGEPAREAEMLVFVEWFNRVWKGPPNEIERELGKPNADPTRIDELRHEMRGWLDVFEQLLSGREYLFSEEFTAADVAAYPFLKYAVHGLEPDDDELFHQILVEGQPLDERRHAKLIAWIGRVDARPRV
jgi:glutathione S-transferase